jgi:hypothetical protein
LGSQGFYALEPGAVQFLHTCKNKAEFAIKSETVQEGTIIDPISGLELDLKAVYSPCANNGDGSWNIAVSLNFDIFQVPSDAYATGDYLNGVNGLFRFKAVEVL